MVDQADEMTSGNARIVREGTRDTTVSDQRFIYQLDQLRSLKKFLFEEKMKFKAEELDAIDLEELNNITYSSTGRSPDKSEWHLLDSKLSSLASYLTDDLKTKIRIRELGAFFGRLPLVFLCGSIFATLAYELSDQFLPSDSFKRENYVLVLLCFVCWVVSQGGLGACAFLGTSAISKKSARGSDAKADQSDDLVDITDRNFLRIRVVSGALFGFLLGYPFSGRALNILNTALFPSVDSAGINSMDIMVVLMPFLAGFSTNLVLAILGRLIIAVEAFFGISGQK